MHGLFVKGLDEALLSFNVHQQQYFGGVRVGNHTHKTLQVRINNYQVQLLIKFLYYLASCKHQTFVVGVAVAKCPALVTSATEACTKFTKTFNETQCKRRNAMQGVRVRYSYVSNCRIQLNIHQILL